MLRTVRHYIHFLLLFCILVPLRTVGIIFQSFALQIESEEVAIGLSLMMMKSIRFRRLSLQQPLAQFSAMIGIVQVPRRLLTFSFMNGEMRLVQEMRPGTKTIEIFVICIIVLTNTTHNTETCLFFTEARPLYTVPIAGHVVQSAPSTSCHSEERASTSSTVSTSRYIS